MPRKRQDDKSPASLEDFSKLNQARKRQLISISLVLANCLYEQEMEMAIFDCGFDGIADSPIDPVAREKIERYTYLLSVYRERAIARIEALADEVGDLRRLLSEL